MRETLRRATAYTAAGADGFFVPGVLDADTIRVIADRVPAPLNVLYRPEAHNVEELAALGVARVSNVPVGAAGSGHRSGTAERVHRSTAAGAAAVLRGRPAAHRSEAQLTPAGCLRTDLSSQSGLAFRSAVRV